MLDEEVPGGVEDHGVEGVGVEGQSVIIVKAIYVHLCQAHLIVGINGGRIEQVTNTWRNQVWGEMWWETGLELLPIIGLDTIVIIVTFRTRWFDMIGGLMLDITL